MSLTHADPKPELRARLRRLRADIPFAERDRRARELIGAFQAALVLDKNDIVGAYANHGAEMSLWPLLQALHGQGVKLALPVAVGPDKPLVFRAWKPGDALVRGAHGNAEPAPSLKLATPSVLLVPLLGFDGKCFRLGQGGGYYDRTLAQLRKSGRVRAIGIAYSVQQVEALPCERHDQQLDAVLTENGLLQAQDRSLDPAPPVEVPKHTARILTKASPFKDKPAKKPARKAAPAKRAKSAKPARARKPAKTAKKPKKPKKIARKS